MGEALAARVDIHADPLSEHQLHVGGMAELNHHSDYQVDALIRPHSPPTELGTLVDGGVPGGFGFHLSSTESSGCDAESCRRSSGRRTFTSPS